MSKNRYLRTRQAKRLLTDIIVIAEESSKILSKYDEPLSSAFEKSAAKLRENLLKHDKAHYEYLTIIRTDGLGLLHTNPLREGKKYTREKDLETTRVKKPTLQIYERDTGEILIDAAVPIIVGDEHLYTIRAGIIIIPSTIAFQIFLWVGLPSSLTLAGFLYFFQNNPWYGFIAVSIVATVATLNLSTKWKKEISKINQALKLLTRGNTKINLKPSFKHELSQVVFGTNNVAIGLQNHITELYKQIEIMQKSVEVITHNGKDSKESAENVKEASNQMQTSSENQSRHIDSISSLMEELAATFEQVSANTQEVSSTTKSVYELGVDGEKRMNELQQEVTGLQESFQQITRATDNLINSMNNIEQFIKLIENIAEQTNILALNATIEAARAGHEGKGFAVVADEVRKLAYESAKAASEIGKLVSKAQLEKENSEVSIGNGSKSLELVTSTLNITQTVFNDITKQIEGVTNGIEDVSVAIQSVASGTTETADSIMEVSQMSESILGKISRLNDMIALQQKISVDLNNSSEELDKVTQHIEQIVSRFKLN